MTDRTRQKPHPRTSDTPRAGGHGRKRQTTPFDGGLLAPPDYADPVIETYKKDVDRTLLRENLKLTVDERFRKLESVSRFAAELREAGRRAKSGR